MSQIAPIAVADATSPTPVTHTFNPVSSGPVALYRESLTAIPLVGQGIMELVNRSGSDAALQRVRVKMMLPALEQVTGQNAAGYTAAPKVAYTNSVIIDFLLPNRGTVQQRKDLRTMLKNSLDNAQVVDMIDNLNVPY